MSEPELAKGLIRSQNKRKSGAGAGARICKRSESELEPELVIPSLNWSRPKYPRLELRDINFLQKYAKESISGLVSLFKEIILLIYWDLP